MLRTSILAMGFALALVRFADAQTWQPPPDGERCPSKWGADDQRGCGAQITWRMKALAPAIRRAVSTRTMRTVTGMNVWASSMAGAP